MSGSEEKRRLLPSPRGSGEVVTPAWWGWLVVASSFYCIAVLDGVGYTTGVMLDTLSRDLGGGRGEVSLVGSIQVPSWTQKQNTDLDNMKFVHRIVK